MVTANKIIILSLLVVFLLSESGCGFFYHLECRKLEKQNKNLISGKETFGLKNKKYKKKNRKTICYYVKRK